MARNVGTNYPFAHQDLATVGAGFFGKFKEWVDVGKGGQGSFPVVIEEFAESDRVRFRPTRIHLAASEGGVAQPQSPGWRAVHRWNPCSHQSDS